MKQETYTCEPSEGRRQNVVTISLPGERPRTQFAILPSSFRITVHSPSASSKISISFYGKAGQLIYITLQPKGDDLKNALANYDATARRKIENVILYQVIIDVSSFLKKGLDWRGEKTSSDFDLDFFGQHWQNVLEESIVSHMQNPYVAFYP